MNRQGFGSLTSNLFIIISNGGEEVGDSQVCLLSAGESVSLIAPKKCKRLKDDGMLRSINFYLLKKIWKHRQACTDSFIKVLEIASHFYS